MTSTNPPQKATETVLSELASSVEQMEVVSNDDKSCSATIMKEEDNGYAADDEAVKESCPPKSRRKKLKRLSKAKGIPSDWRRRIGLEDPEKLRKS